MIRRITMITPMISSPCRTSAESTVTRQFVCAANRFLRDEAPEPGHLLLDMRLFVQNEIQQGHVDFNGAFILGKSQFSELVHEVAHAGSSGAYHLGQHLLSDVRDGNGPALC